ncbi:MAG: NUDIX hydrolase [Candidatus Paceibacterota bacterium]|jgi:8-oxo-dGTP pyrophosphatase MutT (NUDIX family)
MGGKMTEKSDRLVASVSVAVCVERDGKLLMTQKKDTGLWGLPAGHLLKKEKETETILEAARRESMEELGVEVIPFAVLGVYYFPKKEGLSICIVLRASISPKAVFSPKDAEIRKAEWKDAKWVRYSLTSGELYRPEYTVHNLIDWLNDAMFSLTLLREFPGGWME